MIGKILTLITVGSLLFLAPAAASYFPNPVPTAEWDIIFGFIIEGDFLVGTGSEVAAWDESGVVRLRYTISEMDNLYGTTAFYGPPIGSLNPYDFTWRLYDGTTEYFASIQSTTWLQWEGDKNTYQVDLLREEPAPPPHVIPEPATMLVLALLGCSGAVVGLKNRFFGSRQ